MEQFLFESCLKFLEWIFREELMETRAQLIKEIGKVTGKPLELMVWKVLETLRLTPNGERRRQIVILKFGLEDGKVRALEKVGNELDPKVTRERVQFLLDRKILFILRHPSRSRYLSPYLCSSIEEAKKAFKELKEAEKAEKEQKREERERQAFRNFLLKSFLTSLYLHYPQRYVNRIIKSGITYSEFRELPEEKLITQLGMKRRGTKTEQLLLELRRRMLAN